MIEVDVRNEIVTLSELANNKVYFVTPPESTILPYITVKRISGPRGSTHDGPDGTEISRFQVVVYSDNYPESKTLAVKLYALQSSAIAKKITIDNEFDGYDDTVNAFNVLIDFMIYKEA